MVIDTDLPCVGLGLNFRISEFGELDRKGEPSVGFILTETGFVRGSCFIGTFSGGPIGSSLRRFFFFSLLRSSPDLDFLSDLLRSSSDFICEDVIGVIVIELGKAAGGAAVIGMISIPGLRSKHNIEERFEPELELGDLEELDPIGVILTDDGIYDFPSVRSKSKDEALLRDSESLLFSFCLLCSDL